MTKILPPGATPLNTSSPAPDEQLQAKQIHVLELMAFDAPLKEVLEALLLMIESQSTIGLLGSILLADNDQSHLLFGAAPSLPAAFTDVFAVVPVIAEIGPCCQAAFMKAPMQIPDIAHCAQWQEFCKIAMQHGLGACWSSPILTSNDELLGTFAMYYKTARAPDENDMQLVQIAMRTAAIAIERKRSHEALLASEARFRSIVNQTITGVVQIDIDGRMTLMNQRWCEMTGYSEAELLQMGIIDITHADYREDTQNVLARLADGGPDLMIEKRYIRKDGTCFWACSSINGLHDAAGEYTGVVAVVLDNTERKRTEVALQLSEKNSRDTLQSISDGFYALDDRWLFTYVNKAAEILLGHSSEALAGQNFWEAFPSLVGTEFEQHYRRVATERVDITFTAYHSVHSRWYEAHVYPAATGITVYFKDVSSQIEAQEKLELRHERSRLIADISARLVFTAPRSASESVEELLKSVFGSVARHVGAEYYINFAADEEAQTLLLVSCNGLNAQEQAALSHVAFDEALCGTVGITRQPLIIDEMQNAVTGLEPPHSFAAMGANAYAGYPMLADGYLLGTVCFATAKRARFTAEEQELMQTVADLLAVAIQRERSALTVFTSEQKYRSLFDSIENGFCVIELLFDDAQNPIDYLYLETNLVFEKHSGLPNPVGKTIREVAPGIEQYWIDTFGQVALTKAPVRYENYVAPLNRWIDAYAFCINETESHKVGVLFSDITERKRREIGLELLAGIQQDFAEVNDAQVVLQLASEKICRHFDFSMMIFSDIDAASVTARTVHIAPAADTGIAIADHLLLDFFNPAHLDQLKSGHIVAIDNVSNAAIQAKGSAYLECHTGAIISAPYVSDGCWKFLISGTHDLPHHWRTDEIELLGELTSRLYLHLERIRAELCIREGEGRYRALIEASSQIMYRMNADLTGLLVLKGGDIISTSSGIEYDWLERHIHPDDRALVMLTWKAAKSDKRMFELEHRVRRVDGSWGWVFSRAIPLFDGSGEIAEWFGAASDITDRKDTEETLWQGANFDSLTGLPNRLLFRDRLEQEIKKAHRSRHIVVLFFIDLDHFKQVNDMHGHAIGDTLLIEAAKRINACVREFDTVARLGGDEFTAILSELENIIQGEHIAQKIITTIAQPFLLGDEVVHLSASIGITYFPDDAANAEDMIRNADQAMYAAKDAGRNQYSYFLQSMQHQALDRLRLIEDLRNAVRHGQFEVYYQPIIDLVSGRIVKAEALLRWNHPRQGRIDPSIFIPFAEDAGLINEIGDWVFTEAAACSKICEAQRGECFQISVNKSPLQFRSSTKNIDWIDYLDSHNLPASSISIEITEGLLLNTSKETRSKLQQYRHAGIEVAIDDFGTGYSSMAYLKEFDIDYLKVDQSFIQDMSTDKADLAIVRSMIAMAHELDIKVIAEGIETQDQHQLLMEAGCDFGQGFLFSQALPSAEFINMLRIDASTGAASWLN